MPTNHLGIPIQLKNVSDNPLVKGYDTKPSTLHPTTNGLPEDYKEQSNFGVNIGFAAWISLILIFTVFLHVIIFGYLNSQPLNKQCLLLYLYGDSFRLMFVLSWLAAGLATYCKASGNAVKETEAHIISSGLLVMRIGLLLTLNACGFLKVFMAKSGQLDPIAV